MTRIACILKRVVMKKYLFLVVIMFSVGLRAQVPEDAIRYTWHPQNGTARNMAIGGVMGSLGGDLTAAYVNPAGLGFFKTREFRLQKRTHSR